MSDARAGTTSGRISPVNLITATPLLRVPLQRIGFALSKAPQSLTHIFDDQALERQFKTFNFLHTARWASLGRFPRAIPGQARERRSLSWVLFIGNFDGEWIPYFHTFMEALGEGVYDIWSQSIGYPGFPAPGSANALDEWLWTRLPTSQHYYAAYPYATANDVRSAVRVRREACSLALELTAQGVSGPADVTPAFDELLRRLRYCLGPIALPAGSPPATRTDGAPCGIVAVFPVLPGHEEVIKDAVLALPTGTSSPFHRVPGTHFARLALLDRNTIGRHPKKTVTLQNSYLLFAADFDEIKTAPGFTTRYLASIYRAMSAEVHSVWRHCWGFDRVDNEHDFAALGSRCHCATLREFIDCPDQSLWSVLTSLNSQRCFVHLAQRRNGGDTIDADSLRAFLGYGPLG